MNIHDWFSLGLTGLISLQSKGLSRVFSDTTVQKHQFFRAQPSLWLPYLSSGNSSVQFPSNCSFRFRYSLPSFGGLSMCIYSLLFSQIYEDFCSLFLISFPLSRHLFSHLGLPELWSLSLQNQTELCALLAFLLLYHYLKNAPKQKAMTTIRLTSIFFSVLLCILSNISGFLLSMFCTVLELFIVGGQWLLSSEAEVSTLDF